MGHIVLTFQHKFVQGFLKAGNSHSFDRKLNFNLTKERNSISTFIFQTGLHLNA